MRNAFVRVFIDIAPLHIMSVGYALLSRVYNST